MIGNIDTVLVDGCNVLHRWNFFRGMVGDADAKRRRLVAMLENYAALTRTRVVAVFDGAEGGEEIKSAGVKVVFSRKGMTADALIESRLGANPERTLVVSSDQALLAVCRLRGAKTRTSEAFETDLLEFLSRSFAAEGADPSWFKVGDRVRRQALLALLADLKDERARHDREKMVAEVRRLRDARASKRRSEEEELDALRRGLDPAAVKRDDDEGLALFHRMYGKRKLKRKEKDEPEPPPPAAVEDDGFDWVAAMEKSLGGLDPKTK